MNLCRSPLYNIPSSLQALTRRDQIDRKGAIKSDKGRGGRGRGRGGRGGRGRGAVGPKDVEEKGDEEEVHNEEREDEKWYEKYDHEEWYEDWAGEEAEENDEPVKPKSKTSAKRKAKQPAKKPEEEVAKKSKRKAEDEPPQVTTRKRGKCSPVEKPIATPARAAAPASATPAPASSVQEGNGEGRRLSPNRVQKILDFVDSVDVSLPLSDIKTQVRGILDKSEHEITSLNIDLLDSPQLRGANQTA